MTQAELRARYVKIGFGFYVGWVTVFVIEGFYAVTLPTTDITLWIDRKIPVISGFVWVYVSCYLFPWILLAVTSNWHRFNLALLAILSCTLIAFIGHLAIPVAFTRPPLGPSLSDRFVAFIYENDFKPGAQNFPSLHVAIAWIVAFSSRGHRLGTPAELGILLYAMLIMASTLFIKQHLVLDLVGGTVLAFSVWPLVKRRYNRAIPDGQEPLGALSLAVQYFLPPLLFLVLCLAGVIVVQEL